MNQTERMLGMWRAGRASRLGPILEQVTDESLPLRLHPRSNTVGWMLRHVGEVEQLFGRGTLDAPIEVEVRTLGGRSGGGADHTAADLAAFLDESAARLEAAIAGQAPESWEDPVSSPVVGTLPKEQALVRIITHTAYHAGQIALALKYGAATPADGEG